MTTEERYKTDPVEEELVVTVALVVAAAAAAAAAESRPFCVACRVPAVLLPLATGAVAASCESALESVSLECWVAEASLPVGESTLS